MTGRWWAIAVFVWVTLLYVVGFVLYALAGEQFGFQTVVVVAMFGFPLVGALIAYRRPENRIAWLCLVIGLAWALDQALWGVTHYGLSSPGFVSRPELFAVVADPLWVFSVFGILTFLLMLFPDGRLPSARWRWLPWFTAGALVMAYCLGLLQPETASYGRIRIANPLSRIDRGTFATMQVVAILPLFGAVVASVAAMITRFRRSAAVERQQLKWLAWAGAIAVAVFLPAILAADYVSDTVPLAAGMVFLMIPIAIGIAVSRYRLYDLDRILSRTVSYVLVVGMLAAVYFSVVTVLTGFMPGDSQLAVAASTLAVAALFNPLRKRVQAAVDRRFNRSHYDSARVMDTFVGSLQDRTDPAAILDDWVVAVRSTMHPSAIGVWTQDSAPESGAPMADTRLRIVRWGLVALIVAADFGVIASQIVGRRPPVEIMPAAIGALSSAAVGSLIVLRRDGHPTGWFILLDGLAVVMGDGGDYVSGLDAESVAWMATWWWGAVFALFAGMALTFPSGHLPSGPGFWPSTGRWAAVALPLLVLMSMVTEPTGFLPEAAGYVSMFAVVAILLGAVISLVVARGRATGIERAQLTWVVYGFVLLIASLVLTILFVFASIALGAGDPGDDAWSAAFLVMLLLPVTFGVAVLRYRLYDIDRIVSRTVTYALVAGLLGILYGGVVFLLRERLPFEGPVPVAVSTLAVAAAFNPLRRRVQSMVDHRFNRTRYDAQRVADGFADSLREETDPQRVVEGWLGVVAETMHPATMGVWVRSGPSS